MYLFSTLSNSQKKINEQEIDLSVSPSLSLLLIYLFGVSVPLADFLCVGQHKVSSLYLALFQD